MSNPTGDALRFDNRRTGRTTRMVLALPRHRSIVLVHSAHEKSYIENLIRRWRSELRINHDVYVRVIQDERDTDWLRGLTDREIRVDHHVWEALRPQVADYLRVFMRAQFRAHEPRPGLTPQPHWPRLGVVDATVERDASGTMKSVTLPGHDWS